ncbi:DUF2069 domain-containing protein [Pseudoxanthomonas wuyuanensis]|uniref:Predicted membrane protein n=1 Tax=Pseudoxanthomonas wuyuanensis TaxID=1073196 RepID=A0A286D7M7_9GAMM|nr:DUF2069 domain-containing protein [Pseudoxanthomonas wuyuanensis]KAF1720408.1 DUF2069 domain-containing protein [Pseudoxanthomonas wuyuanensis]SOD54659.1 Predicted membrane protein [Pseudoxanthomonas wuyuanensis]
MSGTGRRLSRAVLGTALFALSVLYSVWFHADKHWLAAMLVFVVPPLLMLLGVLRGSGKAAFWAGVFGLFWFSHGVMSAYSQPASALYAWLEIALAVTIVLSASWPGLRGRFGKR